MKRLSLVTMGLLVSLPGLGAGPAVCVLDGGGAVADRACGGERAVADITSTYKAMGSQANFQLLMGPGGKNGAPSCTTSLATCSGGPCRVTGSDSWNFATGSYDRISPSVQQNLNLSNPPGPVHSGTSDSFDKNCFFDSSAGAKPGAKVPVCNLWTVNHGAPEGVTFASADASQPDQHLNADGLRPKADGCSTFKFVTDSCYGAQLSDVMYTDSSKQHLAPNRCGMAAAPKGYQAPGSAAADTTGKNTTYNVKTVEVGKRGNEVAHDAASAPMQIYYPMIESINDQARSAKAHKAAPPSLDQMQAEASRMTAFAVPGQTDADPILMSGLIPTLSSDIFLTDALGQSSGKGQSTSSTMLTPAEAERRDLIRKAMKPDLDAQVTGMVNCIPGSGPPNTAIDNLVNTLGPALHLGEFSDDEKDQIQFDLRDEAGKLATLKQDFCASSQMAKALAGAGSGSCDLEASYQGFVKDRDTMLANADTLKSAAAEQRAKLNAMCAQTGIKTCPDMKELDRKVHLIMARDCHDDAVVRGMNVDQPLTMTGHCSAAYSSLTPFMNLRNSLLEQKKKTIEAERQAAKGAQDAEDTLEARSFERHYEALKLRMAQAIDFYEHGSPDKIREYLSLRRCELSAIDKAVPDSWAALKADRHIATTASTGQ